MPEENREWLSLSTNRLERQRGKSKDERKAENKEKVYGQKSKKLILHCTKRNISLKPNNEI
jgi:hypothetical protein